MAQDARACAVEDAYARHAHLCGVVDEMLHSIQGLVASHSAYVDVLLEVQLFLAHGILGLAAEEAHARARFFFLRFARGHEAVHLHLSAHLPEEHRGCLSVDAQQTSHGGLAFDADI